MADDRDLLPQADDSTYDNALGAEEADEEYALLSEEAFDDALDSLDQIDPEEFAVLPDGHEHDQADETDDYVDSVDDEPETFADDERLRGPRAQQFRRRRQNRIAFFPLALYLLVLGSFLIARAQNVDGLPDISSAAIINISVLVAGFTLIFHALLSGRRERGLLFAGLWIGVTVGFIAVLVYGIDDHPDAAEWWPLLLGSLGVTLIVNYVVERTHDGRLVWLGILCLVAAVVAYGFTSKRIDQDAFSGIADYWPLVFSAIGIGIVPLIFRRRSEETIQSE